MWNKAKRCPIPLRAATERAFTNAGYDATIEYKSEPVPPLLPRNALWADALLREKGLQ